MTKKVSPIETYKNKDWLYQKYIKERLSMWEIAKLINRDHSSIHYWLRKFNIPTRTLSEAREGKFFGKNCNHWRGGRWIDAEGYVQIYCPEHPHATAKRYKTEHRLVMEKHLGRYLKPWEIVHHIDGNRSNNKIKNLFLTTRGCHKHTYADGFKEGFARGFLISYLASSYNDKTKV